MPLRDILLGLIVAALWGLNFVVMKVGVGEVPPFLLAALRFGLGAFPALLLAARPVEAWRWVVAFGLLFGVLKFGLLFYAFKLGMPAGLGALVLQCQAFVTMGLAVALLGERLTGAQVAGAALGLAGLAAIALDQTAGVPLAPLLMTLAAAFAWGLANIATKRAGKVDALAFTVWASAVAALPLMALSLVAEGPATIGAAFAGIGWKGIGAILYLAYPVNLIGVVLWAALLGRHGASAVAPFALLVPVVAMATGHILLGEPITALQAIGGAMIVAGLAIGALGARPARAG